jgi:hypothetical protein
MRLSLTRSVTIDIPGAAMTETTIQQVQPGSADDHSTNVHLTLLPRSRFSVRRLITAVDRWPSPMWTLRLGLHLAIATIPVTAISAHVFGWVPLHTIAIYVMLPLLAAVAALVLTRPDRSDRVVLAGFLWGLLACAGYDAFRLPTIYGMHLWNDFFGSVGGWATESNSNYLMGYLWRYVGDGGGIAVAFFALAATLRISFWSRRWVLVFAVGYGVCPVWAGLVFTDLLAPKGRELFSLSAATLVLSLIGHLIYGLILGYGYWASRAQETWWP